MPKELPEKLEDTEIAEIESLTNERLSSIAEQDEIIRVAQETKAKLKIELDKLQEEGQIKLGIIARPAPKLGTDGAPVGEGSVDEDKVESVK